MKETSNYEKTYYCYATSGGRDRALDLVHHSRGNANPGYHHYDVVDHGKESSRSG